MDTEWLETAQENKPCGIHHGMGCIDKRKRKQMLHTRHKLRSQHLPTSGLIMGIGAMTTISLVAVPKADSQPHPVSWHCFMTRVPLLCTFMLIFECISIAQVYSTSSQTLRTSLTVASTELVLEGEWSRVITHQIRINQNYSVYIESMREKHSFDA